MDDTEVGITSRGPAISFAICNGGSVLRIGKMADFQRWLHDEHVTTTGVTVGESNRADIHTKVDNFLDHGDIDG